MSPSYKRIINSLSIMLILLPLAYSQEFKNIETGAKVKYAKVSYDGSSLVFVANYYGAFRPFISSYDTDSSHWSKPIPLFDSDIISGFNIRDLQLSVDNQKLFFSARAAESDNYDIYFSELIKGKWSAPRELAIGINSPVDELGPAISANEKRILFTRPYPKEAKKDEFCGQLFFSELLETGDWSAPELLPPSYNTGCICNPYYSRDNKTFYFSSYEDVADAEGKRIARNQFSIFWARIDGFFRYNPKPILSIIDKQDLIAPSLRSDSILYYNVGEYTRGEDKIESSIKVVNIRGDLRPSKVSFVSGSIVDINGEPLEAKIEVIDPYTTKVFQEVVANDKGYYQLYIPQDGQFSILASLNEYSTQSKIIETKTDDLQVNFELFEEVALTFNVFDEEFYFQIESNLALFDKDFNPITEFGKVEESIGLGLGKELNIIISSENYFPDTLNLPFDEEVIFDFFDFDIELKRMLKDVALSFADESGNGLGLEVTVYNVTRNEKTKRKVKDGQVTLQLRDGEVYEISTSAEGYSYYSTALDLSKDEQEVDVKATLKSVENVSLVLNNITFEYNSYELNADSYTELNKLITYLEENASYKIEISAFTDDSGTEKYNLALSNLRASSVLQYLQDNAIRKERMIAKGYGEAQPRYPNDSEENMAKNRRVEFKILTE